MGSLLQHVESFVAMHRLLIAVHRFFSSCGAWALECAGSVVVERRLSICGLRAPECTGSVVVAYGLSSCGVQALEHTGSVVVAHGLSWPAAGGILVLQKGIEPTSSASEGRFLTTGPPGKSLHALFDFLLDYFVNPLFFLVAYF